MDKYCYGFIITCKDTNLIKKFLLLLYIISKETSNTFRKFG